MKIKLIPLKLVAHAGNYHAYKLRESSKLFKKVSHKCLQHSPYCQYCGYTNDDQKNLSIINIDGDYKNNHQRNFAVSCPLCTRTQLLDYYPMNYDAGDKMIFLDDLSQAQLNQILHALYLRYKNKEDRFELKKLYASFDCYAQTLNEVAGFELSNPGLYVEYASRVNAHNSLLKKSRWLPSLTSLERLLT
ncbi:MULTISPECIES: hypothetical protein [Cysteiniphilum]|uniref:hypothetical protein n=1 Tax=Cysteiniphilum TaxID=2056696 RepID=UPI0017867349|nr:MULTISPECIES: hypothetical protein [Cysteiniphilum]